MDCRKPITAVVTAILRAIGLASISHCLLIAGCYDNQTADVCLHDQERPFQNCEELGNVNLLPHDC
jgi:hypothetical protein